jgi:hypothetical protein
MGESTMSDAEFDAQCQLIDPLEPTGNAQLDEFFRIEFAPDTGMWIGKHPDLRGVRATYIQHYEPHIPGARERRLAALPPCRRNSPKQPETARNSPKQPETARNSP